MATKPNKALTNSNNPPPEISQTGTGGWKSLLLLQFQTQFRIAITTGILFSYFVTTQEVATTLGKRKSSGSEMQYFTDTKGIIYAFDAFYFIDIIFMISFKCADWPEVQHLYKGRNIIVILIECLTLIPIDALYYQISHKRWERVVIYLRLRYTARLIRLISDRRIPQPMTKQESMAKLTLIFFIIIGLVASTITFALHMYICRNVPNSDCTSEETYLLNFYVSMERITGKGFGEVNQHIYYQQTSTQAAVTVISFLAYIILGYSTSKVVCSLISADQTVFAFLMRVTTMKQELLNWRRHKKSVWKNYHDSLYHTFIRYYEIIWLRRKCYQTRVLVERIIPKIMFKEIYLDMSWSALKHSHLFRNEETHFLRKISEFIRHKFYAPGEILFKHHEYKSGMVYVTNGIIQVLSEENGETPILSLSAGTCIGESSLIIDYPSNWTVVCKTYCEVEMLKKSDFIKVSHIYPKKYRKLTNHILKRYNEAKRLRTISEYQWKKVGVENPKMLTMMFIKRTLHELLKSPTFCKESIVGWDESLAFCLTYLDLYVISEDLELITDSIFLKKQFPVIFQPTSIFLTGWHIGMALLSITVVVFYPIYMVYCKDLSIATRSIIYIIITIFWSLDIYVQISTAVRTKDSFHTTFSSIMYYRLSSPTFIMDLVSVFPSALMLVLIKGSITSETYILSEFPKLFKIHRITFLYSKIETLNLSNRVVLKYVKVFMMSFFLFYYTATILYYILCASKSGCSKKYLRELQNQTFLDIKDKAHVFAHLYSVSSFFLADMITFDFLEIIDHSNIMIIIAVQMVYTAVNILMLAFTAIVETLKEKENHKYKEFVSSINDMVKDLQLSRTCRRRIDLNLKNNYWINKGVMVLNPTLFEDNMSPNLYSLYRQVLYGKFLHSIPLFRGLEENIIIEAARCLKVRNFPAGEVITYAGEVCKEMHIIEFGFCSVKHVVKRTLKPKDSFSVLETCLQIPTYYTVTTLTDCTILSLDYSDYSQIGTRYPAFRDTINAIIENSISKIEIDHIARNCESSEQDLVLYQDEKTDSIKRFRFEGRFNMDRSRFLIEFASVKVIFRYLLLRCTFTSYGRFVFFWEIFRCIFAFTTNILTSFTKICTDCAIFYVLFGLDITAWLDLYVRHHVCYFNKVGIEVSHPMKTAIHYWKNGFLIDLLGAFPLDYLAPNNVRMYYRINRVLQLHRTFGFVRYMNDNNITKSRILQIMKYMPMTLLLVNYISSLNLYMTCDFSIDDNSTRKDNSTRIDNCAAADWRDSFLDRASGGSPRVKLHTAALLLTTTNLSLIGFTKVNINSILELCFAAGLILVGHIFFIWITARMIADNFYKKTDLTDYQAAMKQLLKFVDYRKIDKNIRKEIIHYFEFMWFKTQGKELKSLIRSFNTSLKEDILFDIFGRNMQMSSIFPMAPKSFFKSLLLEAKYEVYINKGIIYRVNDIHGYVFFLLKGHVEVLGADSNKLLILTSGSVFGNLDNCPLTRQTLTMVAKGHVEILKLSSVCFYTVMSQYSDIYRNFRKLTVIHVDYLENWNIFDEDGSRQERKHGENAVGEWRLPKFGRKLVRLHLRLSKVSEETIYHKIWNIYILVVVCLLGFHLNLYHLATSDSNLIGICIAYLFDIQYVIYMYLQFHTSYKDDLGVPVNSRMLIAKNYLKQPLGFYFDLASTIPIEIISLSVVNKEYFWMMWAWCRLNRSIRIAHAFNALKSSREKLHVNVVVMRIFYIICWISVILQTLTTVLFYFRILHIKETSIVEKLKLMGQTYMIIVSTASGAALINQQVTFNIYTAICVVFITLICRFLITVFIAEVCATLEVVNQNKSAYRQFAWNLKQQMEAENVSLPLQRRIREYVNLLWNFHRGVQLPNLLHEAPYYLREAILNAMYGFHIRRHEVLKHMHVDLIRQMAARLNVLVFFPGNYVVYEGDIDQCMYFIHTGQVEVITKDTLRIELVKEVLGIGDVFGLEQGLFGNKGHTYTYKVIKYSIILALERNKWIYLLQFFPASKTIIDTMLDQSK